MTRQIYKSAQGKPIDIDALRARNEAEVAVGNMKTNARGDELGPGGIVLRTRDQVMKEYYASNAVYTKERVEQQQQESRTPAAAAAVAMPNDMADEILAQDAMMDEMPTAPLRGPLADAVAKSAKVDQKLLTPKKTNNGPSRI